PRRGGAVLGAARRVRPPRDPARRAADPSGAAGRASTRGVRARARALGPGLRVDPRAQRVPVRPGPCRAARPRAPDGRPCRCRLISSSMTALEAYARRAEEYTELLGSVEVMAPVDVRRIETWARTFCGPLLDLGCGPGHWTAHLAALGLDVEGWDPVEEGGSDEHTS